MKTNKEVIIIFLSSLLSLTLFNNCAPDEFVADGNGQPYEGEIPFESSDIGFGEELEEPTSPGNSVDNNTAAVGNGLGIGNLSMIGGNSSNYVMAPGLDTGGLTVTSLDPEPLKDDKPAKECEKKEKAEAKKEISYFMEDNAFSEEIEFIEENSFLAELPEEKVVEGEPLVAEETPIIEEEIVVVDEAPVVVAEEEGEEGEAGEGSDEGSSEEGEPEVAAAEELFEMEQIIYSCVPETPGFVDKVEFGLVAGETGFKVSTLSGNINSTAWDSSKPEQYIDKSFESGESIHEVTLLHPLVIVSFKDSLGDNAQEMILCDGSTTANFRGNTLNLLTSDISADRTTNSVYD